MDILEALYEQRGVAETALREFAEPIIAEKRDLTDEEEVTHDELRKAVKKVDKRIKQYEEDAARAAEITEARSKVNLDDVTDVSGQVHETPVYGIGSKHSYVADRVWAASDSIMAQGAQERLAKYGYQVAVEIARGTDEGKRAAEQIHEQLRKFGESRVNDYVRAMEDRGQAGSDAGMESRGILSQDIGVETRTGMSAGSSSGGSFVTPVYFVSDYAPYREAGRAFTTQCNSQPLPDYGKLYML